MNNLYIIPTPIGNLDDLTIRSINILKKIKYLLCEDTKVSGKIKKHLNLNVKLISFHKFNEISRINEVKKMLEDSDVGLISDAGTPTISDPGQLLIKELKKDNRLKIIPLPGANAITTALSGSGLEFDNFTFVGFLEKEESKIINKIKKHLNSDIIVAYESPNRIQKTIKYILKNFGDIEIVVAREISKVYEEIIKNKASYFVNKEFKGEIVLLISTRKIKKNDDLKSHIDKLIELGMNDKNIINYLTTKLKFRKNEIYKYLKEGK